MTTEKSKVDAFFASYTKLTYKAGDTIIRAEDPPAGVYYLTGGLVRQYTMSPTGDTFIVHVYKPGSFFPLMWALSDIPNTFYFEAVTPADVVRAPKERILRFLEKHPDILFATTKRLLTGLHGFIRRTSSLVLDDAYTKTALLLLYYAQNFGVRSGDQVSLPIPLVHREMAAWIGTTRETASLQVEKLARKGLVRHMGRKLIITSALQLEREIMAMRTAEGTIAS